MTTLGVLFVTVFARFSVNLDLFCFQFPPFYLTLLSIQADTSRFYSQDKKFLSEAFQ